MKILKPTEQKFLEQLFQLNQENLLKVMERFLKAKYKEVHSTNDYIIAVGDIPIGLVAHLDTVFPEPPTEIFYDKDKNVMWGNNGLGADDRAGIYAIVQLIKRGLRPTVILTTDEEKGAIGAYKVISELYKPLTDLKYIIQLDRRNSVDCVFYDCDNPEFEEYVESFGFVTAFGTFSDISVICPIWRIAGVNLSIGYIDEHSYMERLYIGHMLATIDKVEKMLRDANNANEFKYIAKKRFGKYSVAYGDELYGSYWYEDEGMCQCGKCGIHLFSYDMFPTKGLDGNYVNLCPDCISDMDYLKWCMSCGSPFITIEDEDICKDCLKKEDINGNKGTV